MLFWLLLRVSTRVNKQLICSFCWRGQRERESSNTQMGRLLHYVFDLQSQLGNSLSISSPQQRGTKLGLWARQESTHFSPLDCDQTGCLVRKWRERSQTADKLNKVRCGLHLTPWSSLVTMPRLAELKIAINKQTLVNAPHTHVLLWRFSLSVNRPRPAWSWNWFTRKAVTWLSTPSTQRTISVVATIPPPPPAPS